ncbi:MAG: glutamyl-tRNA reductase [Deltaproteobacteria bacterium]|nr:glutamyl-tRNA reductase [Deltaproteobacteria bacterium]
MNLLLLGLSHRTAPLELRERYAVDDAQPALAKLVRAAEIEEAVVLSTCNRVEVLVATRDLDAARVRLRAFFERELAPDEAPRARELEGALYELHDTAAVRHAFRVACAVDSQVVGEPQILGQVKDAYRAAVASGACGPILSRLYQRAFATAKRVRNETKISERPISVARVAVQLAEQIFESLQDKSALLVGAGEMIELALETLVKSGLAQVRVANRTPARAAALATRFGASAHGLGELPQLLAASDVVLTCIGGHEPILTASHFSLALHERRERPIFAIDIGVPRNIAPAANELEGVYLYDLDDLQGVARANAEERRREVEHAEAIVLEEQQRFDGWLGALAAVPTIRALVDRGEAVRAAELERALAGLTLGEREREAVEAATRAIVSKLLHAPLAKLRAEQDREAGLAQLEAARGLFGLDDASEAEEE